MRKILNNIVNWFSKSTTLGEKYYNTSNERVLYTFSKPADLTKWLVGKDSDIGGYTNASFVLSPNKTGIFSGLLSIEKDKNLVHSGYAAIVSKQAETPYDLSRFDGISFRMKADGRTYISNLTCDSIILGEIYQTILATTPSVWLDYKIPFSHYIYTQQGFITNAEPEPIDNSQIVSFGLLLADNKPGAFSVEIESIKAICFTAQEIKEYNISPLKKEE